MSKRNLVLLAVDDASDLRRIMDVGLKAATENDADIHVVRVVPHRGRYLDRSVAGWAFARHDAGEAIDAQLASIWRSAEGDGVRAQSVTLRGEPAHIIPAYAQLHGAMMLVLASDYGSSRFFRSARVVDELARHLHVPVLVVPRRPAGERTEPGLRRIVTAVDFSVASAVAMRTALDLSRRHAGRVTLVHALDAVSPHMVVSGSEALELIRQLPAETEAVAGRLRRRAAFLGMNDVDTEVATGFADAAILEIATRDEADLVVMGVAHRSWLDRVLFRSTLRRVLRRATVPVLVVPVVAGAHPWPDEASALQVGGRIQIEVAGERVAA